MQVQGRRDGEVRHPPVGAGTRVLDPTAEAEMHQGARRTADPGECGGFAPALQAVQRPGSPPPVHEAGL